MLRLSVVIASVSLCIPLVASDHKHSKPSSAGLSLVKKSPDPRAADQKKQSFNKTFDFSAHSLITDTTWHPDGVQFAIGDGSHKIALWNRKTREKVKLLSCEDPHSIVYSPNGSMLASVEPENGFTRCYVKLWNAESTKPALSVQLGYNTTWSRVIFDLTSKQLVFARYCPKKFDDSSDNLCLFDIQSQKNSASSKDTIVVRDMTWFNATTLAIAEMADPRGAIRFYDTRTMHQIASCKATIQCLKNQIACLDENILIYNDTQHLATYDLRNKRVSAVPLKNLLSFDLSSDKKTVLIEQTHSPFIGRDTHCLKTFDIATGKCIANIAQQDWKLAPYNASFSSCNKAIIGRTGDYVVGLWEEQRRSDQAAKSPPLDDADFPDRPYQLLKDKE